IEEWPRLVLCCLLVAIELPLLAYIFDPLAINNTDDAWLLARKVLREMVPVAMFFVAAVVIMLAPRFRKIAAEWRNESSRYQWRGWVIANLALFAVLLVATQRFNSIGGLTTSNPPWLLFTLWIAAVGALYVFTGLGLASLKFWRRRLSIDRWTLLVAAGAAFLIEAAAMASRQSWNFLSEATFKFSTAILQLYESEVFVDPANRIIGVKDFDVNIAAACSGYEGIGLVTTFLAIYLWIFRSVLRFPNAYLVIPFGIAAIWILNGVRIAALVSIGAHFSPEVAVNGFHSQAGWMMFLIVTIGIMVLTHRLSFFHDHAQTLTKQTVSPAFREALALLTPFLAMTAAGILAAAFTSEGHWLYSLRVIALSAAIAAFIRIYRKLDWRFGIEPVLLGLLVGAVWIATDPANASDNNLGGWLKGLPPAMAVLWLLMRLAGTIVLVPIAEELAFRGYLHRKLIADRFEDVAEGAFAWKAFFISSALFGVLHERWLSGALAGAVFAVALYRSGKITNAIIAHMTANAVIAFWAIIFGQWTLL
ncbi:MAG: exosortase E/protease, VPEID-CTERM system, partial [Marinicaulis sp.]|nr:exosortase E/protease, VPEID-CTERM system [Marinicaulis sp.]